MIELKNINVEFELKGDVVKAVKDVNLTVNKGEVFGIVGLSGAGKSTLVRVINLLQKPSSGQVLINEKDIKEAVESKEFKDSIEKGQFKDFTKPDWWK